VFPNGRADDFDFWGSVGNRVQIPARKLNQYRKTKMKSVNEQQKFNFIKTAAQLRDMKPEPSDWIVDGLLRAGRKRISLLGGKPESGKSTLNRQLAVRVAQGKPFLGRHTKKSEVLLWQSEEDLADIWESFDHLGYNPSTDAPIYIFDGSAKANSLTNLNNVLSAHPKIRLVTIETLDDLLRISDVKENSATREAFQCFEENVLDNHYKRVSFIGLHHLKKRACDDSGEMILGATYLRGRTDTKIYLDHPRTDDERRIVHATVRKGNPIPKTYLNYDAQRETISLGMTLAEEYKAGAAKTAQRIEEEILQFFASHPDTTFENDCRPFIAGNSNAKRRALNKLVASGKLLKSGNGTKGAPVVYRVVELTPTDRAELNQQMGIIQ
jgi:hypothetical protein